MAEVNNDIVIRYSLQGIDEVNAAHQKIAAQTKAFNQSQITEAKSTSAQKVKIASDEVTQKVTHLKRFADYEKEYAGKSTATLRDAVRQHIILISDEKTARLEALDAGNKAEAAASQKRIQIYQNEQNKLRQLLAERPSVMYGGFGAMVGQLGIGRQLTGIGAGALGPFGGIVSGLSAIGPAGIAAGAGIGAAAFAIKKIIDSGAPVEDALATLSAQSGITGAKLEDLRKKAEAFSDKFGVTATDSVDAFRLTINALGLDITKNVPLMNRMTQDVMTFATAAGVDAATSASALANTFNEMGFSIQSADAGEQFSRVMNVIAAAARQGNAQIVDLISSFQQIGPLAHQQGLSIETTAAAMEVLAHQNIRGSDAGVMFRDVLLGLADATRTSDKAFKQLGLNAKDIDPKVIGLSSSLQIVRDKLEGLNHTTQTQVLRELFGKGAITAGTGMLSNIELLDEFTQKVTGTQTAAEMAAEQLHTFHKEMARIHEEIANIGIDAFFKYRMQIEHVVDVIARDLPKAIDVAIPVLHALTIAGENAFLPLYDAAKAAQAAWDFAHGNVAAGMNAIQTAEQTNMNVFRKTGAFLGIGSSGSGISQQFDTQTANFGGSNIGLGSGTGEGLDTKTRRGSADQRAYESATNGGYAGSYAQWLADGKPKFNYGSLLSTARAAGKNIQQAGIGSLTSMPGMEEFAKAVDKTIKTHAEAVKKIEHDTEEQANKVLAINKRLRDDIIGLDKDAEEKKKLQAAAKYEDTKKEIEAEKVDEDTKNKQLIVAKAIYEQELSVAADTVTSKVDKQSEAFTRLTEAINGTSDAAKNWGEIGGVLIAVIADKLFPSNTAKQTTGLPDNLKAMLPAGMIPSFQDTPGTLSQSGAIPMGDGTYLVRGAGNDRLVKDNGFQIPVMFPHGFHTETKEEIRKHQAIARAADKRGLASAGALDPIDYAAFGLYGLVHGAEEGVASSLVDKILSANPLLKLTKAAVTGAGREEFEDIIKEIGTDRLQDLLSEYASDFDHSIRGGSLLLSAGFGAHVPGTTAVSLPSFHDSPSLAQAGAPRIGNKYLVAGAGDDMLVKGGTLPEVLTLAVTKGINAAKITENTKKTATATEKAITPEERQKAFMAGGGAIASVLDSAVRGKGATAQTASGLLSGASDILSGVKGGSDVAQFASTMSGLVATPGNVANIFNQKGASSNQKWGSALTQIAPLVSMIPGFGTIAGAGMELLGGILGSSGSAPQARNPIAGFATGTAYVPKTGLAVIHEGERITSKNENASGLKLHSSTIAALARAISGIQVGIQPSAIRSGYGMGNNQYNTWD